MVQACCVDSCLSIKRPRCSFYEFPLDDPERLRQWLFSLDMDLDTPSHVLSELFVCQRHFQDSDYYDPSPPGSRRQCLKTRAVPTQFIPNTWSSESAMVSPLRSDNTAGQKQIRPV